LFILESVSTNPIETISLERDISFKGVSLPSGKTQKTQSGNSKKL
jgi:hypothetical protein